MNRFAIRRLPASSLIWLLPICYFSAACQTRSACGGGACGSNAASGPADLAHTAQRQVSAPSAMAVAQNTPQELGPSVTLGDDVDGPATLYLRFPALSAGRDLKFAWLVLEPRDSTFLAQPLTLEVGRARGPFASGGIAQTAQPGLTSPIVEQTVLAGTVTPIRIDVTKLLQHFVTHSGHEPLLAVRARDARGTGLTLNTGIDGGRAPRLDTYWRD